MTAFQRACWLLALLTVTAAREQTDTKPGEEPKIQYSRNSSVNPGKMHTDGLETKGGNSDHIPPETFSTVNTTVGHEVALHCSNATQDTITVRSWKINTGKGNTCLLSFSPVGNRTFTNCSKHPSWKPGHQMSSIFINPVGLTDEGEYVCETASPSGNFKSHITLNVQVPPEVTLTSDGSSAAVCKASRGKPAADISWEPPCEACRNEHQAHLDKTVTVISRYKRTSKNETNVTCMVAHPTFSHPQHRSMILSEDPEQLNSSSFQAALSIGLPIVFCLVILACVLGLIFYWKSSELRQCYKFTRPQNPSIHRQPPNDEVEEVEPYASYMQKENTIYNSISELTRQ
ncbi:cell surface glycoprotein CD200 receptor 1-A-like [Ambystoma mexicanum]|uniref:cell surface glycoprotein CD200 receptor 1-A-like n=1 Tax=Ambystoma mexicanum TaxID=8296 RepID=UPI0037E912E0